MPLYGALDRSGWDVVLSDCSMPSFSAKAALEVVKERGRDIPFIIVSGSIGEERAVEVLEMGAQAFVLKDKLARLLPAIERELRERSERRKGRQAERALDRDHDVETTVSGLSALRRIASGEYFDIILCDLMMPQVTGMDFHRQLSETYPGVAARVVFISGGAFTERARRYVDGVGAPCIEKSFDMEALRSLVNGMLGEPAVSAEPS